MISNPTCSCWLTSTDKKKMEEIMYYKQHQIGTNKDGNTVFLADNDYMINLAKRDFPKIEFTTTSELTKNLVVKEALFCLCNSGIKNLQIEGGITISNQLMFI